MRSKLIIAVLVVAPVICLAQTAVATTWYVNGVSGSDSNNCTSPTTACKTIGHSISLASSGDAIIVAAATYSENLTIAFNLTFTGSGASTTTIDGGGLATVFTISSASANVTLSKVTIRNGNAVYGGGINNSGTLTLNRSRVSGNTGVDGGGLWNGGTVTINKSTISSNVASAPSCTEGCGRFGGGIYNSGGATLTISNSTVSGNGAHVVQCQSGGCVAGSGGIANSGGATLTISNSTVSGNVASVPLTLGIHKSLSFSVGGGIGNSGTMAISKSTFSRNKALIGLAAGYGSGGGGISNGGTMTISNSTIGGNSSFSGGGISNGGSLIISNSTVSSNTENLVYGGGISNGGTATFQNTIVANNSGKNCIGMVISNGYNLSTDDTCNFTNAGDLNNTDPMLGPLQNNGGPTQTMALPSGSPAVDAGNPSGCTDDQGRLLKTDQRGKPRPDPEDAGGCDIGAYESQSD